jgi:hypothetical protein
MKVELQSNAQAEAATPREARRGLRSHRLLPRRSSCQELVELEGRLLGARGRLRGRQRQRRRRWKRQLKKLRTLLRQQLEWLRMLLRRK